MLCIWYTYYVAAFTPTNDPDIGTYPLDRENMWYVACGRTYHQMVASVTFQSVEQSFHLAHVWCRYLDIYTYRTRYDRAE